MKTIVALFILILSMTEMAIANQKLCTSSLRTMAQMRKDYEDSAVDRWLQRMAVAGVGYNLGSKAGRKIQLNIRYSDPNRVKADEKRVNDVLEYAREKINRQIQLIQDTAVFNQQFEKFKNSMPEKNQKNFIADPEKIAYQDNFAWTNKGAGPLQSTFEHDYKKISFDDFLKEARAQGSKMTDAELRVVHETATKAASFFTEAPELNKQHEKTLKKAGIRIANDVNSVADDLVAEEERLKGNKEKLDKDLEKKKSRIDKRLNSTRLGQYSGGVLGGIAAQSAEAGGRVALVMAKCSGNLSITQATAISKFTESCVACSTCGFDANAADDVLSMKEDDLKKLCEEVPQLPQVVNDMMKSHLAEVSKTDWPQDIQVNCSGSKVSSAEVNYTTEKKSYQYESLADDAYKVSVKENDSNFQFKTTWSSKQNRFDDVTGSGVITSSDFPTLEAKRFLKYQKDHAGKPSQDPFERKKYLVGEGLQNISAFKQLSPLLCEGGSSPSAPAVPGAPAQGYQR